MKRLVFIINFLLLFFLARGQDIWFIYQEFSSLNSINNFDEWKHHVETNKNVTCYLVEKGKDNSMEKQRHEEYRFKYKNIPVEYATIKVHFDNDKIRFINGEWFKEECFEGLDVMPSITEDIAFNKAIEYIGAEQYIWENNKEYKYLELTEQEYLKSPPKGELIICKNYMNAESKKISLAYKFEIYATTPLSRNYVYVDAHTGKIIHVNSLIRGAYGNADTRYSATKIISTDYYNGLYRLRDYSGYRGSGIETYNMNNGANYAAATDFYDYDNDWTSAEFNNPNKDNAALDAHWGAMMTYDYFYNIHERNGIDGQGLKIINYVHANLVAMNRGFQNNCNAFWDGSVMTYGDGDNSNYDVWTCLDIVAHEITHGITQNSSANLVYQGESGALNESISDIFAVGVENYVGGKPFSDLWSIGEDITLQESALRYLYMPVFGGQPSFYQGPLWYSGFDDFGGVHTNSGVFNFWFYLLTNGGSGTNMGTPYSISGIGINKAEKFIYWCLTDFFTPNTNYSMAAMLTTNAALIRFGACSPEVKSVVDAWHAVGITDLSVSYQNDIVLTGTIPSNAIRGFGAVNTIQSSNIIQTGANVTYRAGDQITLSPGFKVDADANFYAYILPCLTPQKSLNGSNIINDNVNIYQQNTDNQKNKFQKDVILYPNPTKDVVHLSFIEQNSDVYLSIYDIVGKELFKKIITDDNYDVDLSPYHTGVYLFRITSKEYKHTFKIIKQ